MQRINRRRLVGALGAAACGAALPTVAQQPKVWRIGVLSAYSQANPRGRVEAFQQGMRNLGYIEGKNIVIERRFADGDYKRLPSLAAELVREKVDVIVAIGSVATSPAQQATKTIPIVALAVGDPVGTGFATSLARPGGNVTGFSVISPDIIPKRLELLLAIAPRTKQIGVLGNPRTPTYPIALKSLQAAGRKADIGFLPFLASSPDEIESRLAEMAQKRLRAAIILADSFLNQYMTRVAELSVKHRLATISPYREYVVAGGLMSYGPEDTEAFRRGAIYVDKILKGAKPGELPFEQPAKFHLVINGNTAKALGLKIPQELLLRADEVIE